jgi:transcription initiation factor TFIIIB Brf1 subunit/transcription initiation factor TFIIB
MPQEYICQAAIEAWGEDAQLDMVIEKCSELIQAILKYKRSHDKEIALVFVAEEHADVNIMLDQLAYMMSKHDRIDQKTYRVLKRDFTKDKVTRLVNRLEMPARAQQGGER